MSFENDGNSFALQRLVQIEQDLRAKDHMLGSPVHQVVVQALGECGGSLAVEHLIKLEAIIIKEDHMLGSPVHQAVIGAIGRAGRIS